MSRSRGYGGGQAAQPNNTFINIDSYRASSSSRMILYCCSNSSSNNVGSFTYPYGYTSSYNFRDFRVQRYSWYSSYRGCIRLEGYRYRYSYMNYYSGVYTCNIPDGNGITQTINFAIYSENSKKDHNSHYTILYI